MRNSSIFLATLVFFAAYLPAKAETPPVEFHQVIQGVPVKEGKNYVVDFKCWVRRKGNPALTPDSMKTYMKGLKQTKVFHTITLSQGQPEGSNLDTTATFSLPGKVLQIPLLAGSRSAWGKITNLYDGSKTCPERVLLSGSNNIFLTSVFFSSNKKQDNSAFSKIVGFLSQNFPSFRLVIFNDESSDTEEARLEEANDLASAVEDLVNGWRSNIILTSPRHLTTGKLLVSSELVTTEITVREVPSFISQSDIPTEALLDFIPSGANPPEFSEDKAKFRADCIAWRNKLADAGLRSVEDQAHLITRHVRRLELDSEQLVRCLVVGPRTEAAIGPFSSRIETRPDLALTRAYIIAFAASNPEEVPSPIIKNEAFSKRSKEARRKAAEGFYEVYIHRVRRAESAENIASDIQAEMGMRIAPVVLFSDRTREGNFDTVEPKQGPAFNVLKSITELGVKRWGCFLEKTKSNADLFYEADLLFLGFQVEPKDDLDADKAFVFLPEFDAQDRIAKLVVRDQRVAQTIAAHSKCIKDKS